MPARSRRPLQWPVPRPRQLHVQRRYALTVTRLVAWSRFRRQARQPSRSTSKSAHRRARPSLVARLRPRSHRRSLHDRPSPPSRDRQIDEPHREGEVDPTQRCRRNDARCGNASATPRYEARPGMREQRRRRSRPKTSTQTQPIDDSQSRRLTTRRHGKVKVW